jgi:mannose-6-phosphate isomerase
MLSEPLTFLPLYQQRVWGGRRLEELLGRSLPAGSPVGEAWEMVDRPEAQSMVRSGPFAGLSLHQLWRDHRMAVFGTTAPDSPRFPLLTKILDARETLSVQVHPPASIAASLGAEPKTEMWYVLEAENDAAIYAGFKKGVTRRDFLEALHTGEVDQLLHRIPVRSGDAITIPSGRCHAIGQGCLIAEIQQNSDSTYRVFDWNRLGLDGKPRELHIPESLQSIQFEDYEPSLAARDATPVSLTEWFRVDVLKIPPGETRPLEAAGFILVLDGSVRCGSGMFGRGASFWMPASGPVEIDSVGGGRVLRAGFGG